MLHELLELDKEIFLFLNSFHTPWLDPVMLFITETYAWLPLYIFLLYVIFRDLGIEGWIALVGITLTIVLADQVTSSIMKPYFARLRPSQDPALEGLIHIVNGYKGGKYGFASGHAANTFGAATFLYLILGKKHRWALLLFLWAAVVTYSRIYLGVHYPGDIMAGGMVGVLAGAASYGIFRLIRSRVQQRKHSRGLQ